VSQRQCPWCGRLGPRVSDRDLGAEHAQPHADGSSCVCRHVSCMTRLGALSASGRYFDRGCRRWLCFACGTTQAIPLDDIRAREAEGIES
jgi:hypothetical protein